MARFLFSYRVPHDYKPGPKTSPLWTAWFDGMGASRLDQGSGVKESSSLGDVGPDTRLGGYSVVAADDLEAAVAIAKGCPAIGLGGGVEVGVILEAADLPRPASEG
jgi:hypothetical protein